jgi:glycosyltransferase involved in cell wall biosynthesis
MNIVLISEQYYPPIGGVSVFVSQLARNLVKEGHKVTLITAAPGTNAKLRKVSEGKLAIYQMPTMPLVRIKGQSITWPTSKEIVGIVERLKPDVVHVNAPLSVGSYFLFWKVKRLGLPVVFTNHALAENWFMDSPFLSIFAKVVTSLFWKITVKVANSCDFVTSPTESALSMLKNHGVNVPSQAITNGVNNEYFVPAKLNDSQIAELGIAKDKECLVYVGRIDGEKRVDILISAMPAILKERPNAQLVLVGKGKFREDFEKLAVKLGVSQSVQFMGFVSQEEKRALLQMCKMFVIASPVELQCIAGLEAMACGAPVVVADQAALRDLCGSNERGRMFKFPSPASLAEEAIILLSDDKLRQKLSDNALEFITKKHSAHISCQNYVKVYRQISG